MTSAALTPQPDDKNNAQPNDQTDSQPDIQTGSKYGESNLPRIGKTLGDHCDNDSGDDGPDEAADEDEADFSPIVLKPGALPPVASNIADLLTVTQARTSVDIGLYRRDITCFNGEPGTGKTTAATLAVQQVGGVDWRYCIPPVKATTKGAMVALYEAVFGFGEPRSERDAVAALVRRLSEGDIGIIIDEVHHVGLVGMQQYRHLWDRVGVHGKPFPMVLVGCKVRETLAQAEEVRSRIARWVLFDTVQHHEDLRTLTARLHPRLALTKHAALDRINERITRGSIREWAKFADHIEFLPSSRGPAKGLTQEDIRRLQNLMGTF